TKTTRLWVDGSYTEDASTLDQAVDESIRNHSEYCHKIAQRRTRLGRLPAVELVLRCMSGANGPDILKQVIAFGGDHIRFAVGRQRSVNERSTARLDRTFQDLIRGFAVIPRQ